MTHRVPLHLKAFAALVLLIPVGAMAENLAGTWSGAWIKNGDALPVVATFARSGDHYSGTFDSDALQVSKIPFAEVSQFGSRVHFVLKGDQSTILFEGHVSDGAIEGTLTENSARGSFHLARSKVTVPEIHSRDVSFRNGDVSIAGTILLPGGRGHYPAIVFLNGSGPEGRFANRWLAEHFVRSGFVALIYDKRGVGQSTGDWKKAGFEDLAGDAVAGVRLLQSMPNVDAGKVGIFGHSQGGTIAPLVAAEAKNLGFVIASAPAGIDPAEVEEYSVGNSLGIASLPPNQARDAREFVHAIVDVAFRGHSRNELDAISARFEDRNWHFDPPPPDNFYWSFSRRIAEYQPGHFWAEVRAPVLLLFAGKDERIPSKQSARAIIAALPSHDSTDLTVKSFPSADHTFSLPVTNGGWPKHVPDYAAIVVKWAKATTKRLRPNLHS